MQPIQSSPSEFGTQEFESTQSLEGSKVPDPNSYANAVDVKFRLEVDSEAVLDLLPPKLRSAVTSAQPLFQIRDPKILTARPDLSRWFRLSLKASTDLAAFAEELMGLEIVESAEVVPPPAPPP